MPLFEADDLYKSTSKREEGLDLCYCKPLLYLLKDCGFWLVNARFPPSTLSFDLVLMFQYVFLLCLMFHSVFSSHSLRHMSEYIPVRRCAHSMDAC